MKKLTILNVIILLAFSLLNATIIHIPADFPLFKVESMHPLMVIRFLLHRGFIMRI